MISKAKKAFNSLTDSHIRHSSRFSPISV